MELSINPNRIELDEAYMQMAEVWAKRSKATRKQVGALIVKDRQIISDGYNGMPAGDPDDVCEEWHFDGNRDRESGYSGELRTKQEVLHAESNALAKIAENGGVGAQGGTLYVTMSPCKECAKLIKQAKIKRVVFREQYRDDGGIDFLLKRGVSVEQLVASPTSEPSPQMVAPPPPPAPPPVAPRPSLLKSVIPSQNEALVNSLRAQVPVPPPPPQPPAAVFDPPKLPPPIPPVEVDPDVQALLREFEQHQAAQANGGKPPASSLADDGGGYKSSFL